MSKKQNNNINARITIIGVATGYLRKIEMALLPTPLPLRKKNIMKLCKT